MKRVVSLAFVVAPLLTGCGPLLSALGGHPASPQPAAQDKPVITDDVKEAVRRQEAAADAAEAAGGNMEKEQTDRTETELKTALAFSLGQSTGAPTPAGPPEKASATIATLRQAKIKLRIEPVVDQQGKPVADNFLQVKDSYTDRVQQLSRKMAEQKATPAEMKEVQAGAKYAMRLNDLKMQLGNVSRATMMANSQVQTSALTTMLRVASLVRSRKQMEMEITEADYAKIKGWLERERRVEALAATSMATLATYQAVLDGNADPKAIDVLSESTLKAFPLQPTVTIDEAKDYVKNLSTNVGEVKKQYEAMMRKAHGDTVYEQRYKAGIDAMFRQAEGAQSQKSATEMAADSKAAYDADIAKCGRGEPISPGSLVSPPRCKQVREAVQRGEPIPTSVQASNAGGGDSGGGGGLLGGLLSSIPGFNVVSASLSGIQAIVDGDPKAALRAAMTIIPGGGMLSQGLASVDKLLQTKDKAMQMKDRVDQTRTNLTSMAR